MIVKRQKLFAFLATIFGALPVTVAFDGYVGPACAVVDNRLFLHGLYIRRLSDEELRDFHCYQTAVDIRRQLAAALARGVASVAPRDRQLLAAPPPPNFCDGVDDTVEVVLDGCTVRNNKVYVADQLIRPLDPVERIIIGALIQPVNHVTDQRRKRSTENFVSRRRRNTKRSLKFLEPLETSARSKNKSSESEFQMDTVASTHENLQHPFADPPIIDPLLLNLLQSLATQQQSVSEIVEYNTNNNNNYSQQQQHSNNNNYNNNINNIAETLTSPSVSGAGPRINLDSTGSMRVGGKILINGRTYVAVPLASFATPSALFGGSLLSPGGGVMMLGLTPVDVLRPTAEESLIGHVRYGNGRGLFPDFGAASEMPISPTNRSSFHHYFSSNLIPEMNLRLHPKSVSSTVLRPLRLPHEICRNV